MANGIFFTKEFWPTVGGIGEHSHQMAKHLTELGEKISSARFSTTFLKAIRETKISTGTAVTRGAVQYEDRDGALVQGSVGAQAACDHLSQRGATNRRRVHYLQRLGRFSPIRSQLGPGSQDLTNPSVLVHTFQRGLSGSAIEAPRLFDQDVTAVGSGRNHRVPLGYSILGWIQTQARASPCDSQRV